MGRTVPELLESVSSKELAELRAYEIMNGPIGPQYEQQTLAAIHEQIQRLVSTLISINVEDQDNVPEVQHYPRPNEINRLEE